MDEKEIGFCPRCGRELVRGATPTGKVCFRCPSCGGMAVTLPVLRESLDAKSIAALTRSARAAEHVGCLCPGCAGRMTLLKVGDDKVGLLSNYAWLCGLAMLAMSFLRSASCDYYSFGLGPIVACVALGAFLGQRSRKRFR